MITNWLVLVYMTIFITSLRSVNVKKPGLSIEELASLKNINNWEKKVAYEMTCKWVIRDALNSIFNTKRDQPTKQYLESPYFCAGLDGEHKVKWKFVMTSIYDLTNSEFRVSLSINFETPNDISSYLLEAFVIQKGARSEIFQINDKRSDYMDIVFDKRTLKDYFLINDSVHLLFNIIVCFDGKDDFNSNDVNDVDDVKSDY